MLGRYFLTPVPEGEVYVVKKFDLLILCLSHSESFETKLEISVSVCICTWSSTSKTAKIFLQLSNFFPDVF